MCIYQDTDPLKSHQESWLQTSDHSLLPLLKTCRKEDIQMDFCFLGFQREWICLEKAFVHFAIRPSSLQEPVGESASWSGGPHGQIPPAQTGPLCFPLALGSQWHWCTEAVSPGLSAESPPSTSRSPEGKLVTAGNTNSCLKLPALPGWWQRNRIK